MSHSISGRLRTPKTNGKMIPSGVLMHAIDTASHETVPLTD
jgi:hypothetical protein